MPNDEATYFLRMPELWNLIFCIWNRRLEVLELSTRFWEFLAHVTARENVMVLCFNHIRRCIYSN